MRFSRFGLILTLAFIGLASLFGRPLARHFSDYLFLIPYIGILLFATILVGFIKVLNSRDFSSPSFYQARVPLVTALLAIALGELLVFDPIERIHLFKYALLTFFSYHSQQLPKNAQSVLGALCCAGIIGAGEEMLQSLIPERIVDPRDLLLNASGALIGGSICWAIDRAYNLTSPALRL